MDLKENWADIQDLFKKTASCSIATVNEYSSPNITPIGSLFLRNDQTGFYFEGFSQKMPKNLDHNNRICIMAAERGFLFWMKSFFKGLCPSTPGVRLYGTVGERRLGSEEEIASFLDRVKKLRKRKIHEILFKNMKYLREIKFDSFEPVNLGPMTQHLWKD